MTAVEITLCENWTGTKCSVWCVAKNQIYDKYSSSLKYYCLLRAWKTFKQLCTRTYLDLEIYRPPGGSSYKFPI